MLDTIMKKLCSYYVRFYKRQVKAGKETTAQEDELFAYCVLELKGDK